jgi:hypothetical protein
MDAPSGWIRNTANLRPGNEEARLPSARAKRAIDKIHADGSKMVRQYGWRFTPACFASRELLRHNVPPVGANPRQVLEEMQR